MSNKDERYITIARACLKALNGISTASSDTQKNIQAVYEAIDEAFRREFQRIEQSRYISEEALRAIADLSDDGSRKARQIAIAALTEIENSEQSGLPH